MNTQQVISIDEAAGNELAVRDTLTGSPQLAQFESEAVALKAEADALTITDQDSYERAVACGNRCAGALKRWTEFIKRPYDVVYGAYKTMLATKKAVEDPLEAGKKLLGQKITNWNAEQERVRLAKQRELEEAQRRQEEEAKLNAAAKAEAHGASEQAVEQILAQPSVAPKPVAAPTYQRSTAASIRENWAGEVTDFHQLVKAAAKDKKLLPLLQVNQAALNAQARIHKATLADVVPGTRGVNKGATSFRQAV